MTSHNLPPEFVEYLHSIKGKRAKIVVNHILEHGFITSEEIQTTYGYKHPPRAVRDVREQGVPIETFNVQDTEGRTIAAYRFGDPQNVQMDRVGGRVSIPKRLKQSLLSTYDSTCSICNTKFDQRYLQADHRVPYEISGDSLADSLNIDNYMLLCGSCNRAKSWMCEHCQNYIEKNIDVCMNCYWATPDEYSHIALEVIRRVDIVWTDSEIAEFEQLFLKSTESADTLQDYIKAVLRKFLEEG